MFRRTLVSGLVTAFVAMGALGGTVQSSSAYGIYHRHHHHHHHRHHWWWHRHHHHHHYYYYMGY